MVLGLLAWISIKHEVQRLTGKPYMGEIFRDIFRAWDQSIPWKWTCKLPDNSLLQI
jgi:hypothetical protein